MSNYKKDRFEIQLDYDSLLVKNTDSGVKKSSKNSKERNTNFRKLVAVLAVVVFFVILGTGYYLFFATRVHYGVSFMEEDLSFKTKREVKDIIVKKFEEINNKNIRVNGQKLYFYNPKQLGISLDENATTEKAVDTFKKSSIASNLISQITAIGEKYDLSPEFNWNDEVLSEVIVGLEKEDVLIKAKQAEYKVENGTVIVIPSVTGYEIDVDDFKNQIKRAIEISGDVNITQKEKGVDFDTETAEKFLEVAKKISTLNIQFKYDLYIYKLSGEDLVNWITIKDKDNNSFRLGLNENREYQDFFEKIAKSTNRDVKNPVLKIEGDRVVEFTPPQDGRELDVPETIAKAFIEIERTDFNTNSKAISIDLVVRTTKPENFENNQYGIREFLSRGISDFSGSASGRIHNIKLAASRINGSLIAPGEEFSFNKKLGDVSASTGYQSAYVIENGKTVLGDGGGVCQVSTTAFRAALNAGLKITVRSPHAYRVAYYEKLGFKPGLDAAIYYPSLDLRFINNTPKYVLISAYVTGTRLIFDLYGTSDDRQVKISEPVVSNLRPAPESKYQDDPTLPRGTVKQVDFAASGATTKFTQTVSINGEEIINESFASNYRPWQAVYLVGTKDN